MLTPILEEVDITLYLHGDGNNLWRVLNATADGHEQYDYEHKPIVYIEHGTRIKLRHVATDKGRGFSVWYDWLCWRHQQ
ncbi:hypothetical protein M405DRAFT_833818 [Rhizopogon salebrosus TDB-379]|nr:hypothetical protein M405DRAFT_833818 [Rhizopogon salebrosus TDB-379]